MYQFACKILSFWFFNPFWGSNSLASSILFSLPVSYFQYRSFLFTLRSERKSLLQSNPVSPLQSFFMLQDIKQLQNVWVREKLPWWEGYSVNITSELLTLSLQALDTGCHSRQDNKPDKQLCTRNPVFRCPGDMEADAHSHFSYFPLISQLVLCRFCRSTKCFATGINFTSPVHYFFPHLTLKPKFLQILSAFGLSKYNILVHRVSFLWER